MDYAQILIGLDTGDLEITSFRNPFFQRNGVHLALGFQD